VPPIGIGNKPIDDGNYLFLPEEKSEFLKLEPLAKKWFRRWIGSDEFINGWERWCLWLGDCPPEELRQMPYAMQRVAAVRKFRQASKSAPTRAIAATPTRFHVENMPKGTFLVIPKVSSERRRFIPIGFLKSDTLVSDLCFLMPRATLFHFGVMSSEMHMAWLRQVGGRLESRFRYSARLVFNNFPWPGSPTARQSDAVKSRAQKVLDVRAAFPDATLADLYDPVSMPARLVRAHADLSRAVDACYRTKLFHGDLERVEFLLGLHRELTHTLIDTPSSRRRARRRTTDEPQ
jgi:hypothetical protein